MSVVRNGRPRSGAAKQTAMPWRGGDRLQNWATPRELFLEIERRYGWGGYTLDPCAEPWSAKCPAHFTAEDDGLAKPWGDPRAPGRAFINPPFDDIVPWFAKARAELSVGNIELATFLVPARVGAAWWHEHAQPHGRVIWTIGRINFDPPPGYEGDVTSHGEDFVVVNLERPLVPRELRKVARSLEVLPLLAGHEEQREHDGQAVKESA